MISILLLSTLVFAAGQEVSVSYGKIAIADETICNITMYNSTLYNVEKELPRLYYELIRYDCNTTKGYIVSKPKCFECGVYCPQNELLLTCNQFWFPFSLGSVIGTIIAIFLLAGAKILVNRYCETVLGYLTSSKNTRRQKKMEKIRNFLEQDEAERQKLREERETRGRRGSATLLAALLASSHIRSVTPCDRSLYITSTNTICEEEKCTETNTFLLNIENNMKICFNGLGTNPLH